MLERHRGGTGAVGPGESSPPRLSQGDERPEARSADGGSLKGETGEHRRGAPVAGEEVHCDDGRREAEQVLRRRAGGRTRMASSLRSPCAWFGNARLIFPPRQKRTHLEVEKDPEQERSGQVPPLPQRRQAQQVDTNHEAVVLEVDVVDHEETRREDAQGDGERAPVRRLRGRGA